MQEPLQAATVWCDCRKLDPEFTDAQYHLGKFARDRGDYEEAADMLAKVDYQKHAEEVRDSSDDAILQEILAQTLMACAHLYAEAGRMQEAADAWLKVAVILPTQLQCRHELLYLFETCERLEDAVEISQKVCELEPQNPDHWLNLGLLNVRLERRLPAQEAMEKALQLAPDNPQGSSGLRPRARRDVNVALGSLRQFDARLVTAFAVVLALSDLASAAGPIVLKDVTDQTGIEFLHTDGGSGRRNIVETVSAG